MMSTSLHALASKCFADRILRPATNNHRRFPLRKFAFFAMGIACFALPNLASAQQGDAMLGFTTLMSPGASDCNIITFTCPEKGGLYMNLGADVILHRRIGFGFDAT